MEELNNSLPESTFPLNDLCSDCEICYKDNCKMCIVTKIQHYDTRENR